jgi:hypothetical protein
MSAREHAGHLSGVRFRETVKVAASVEDAWRFSFGPEYSIPSGVRHLISFR